VEFKNDCNYLNFGQVEYGHVLSSPFIRFDEHVERLGNGELSLLQSVLHPNLYPQKKDIMSKTKKSIMYTSTSKRSKLSYRDMAEMFEDANDFLNIDKMFNIYDKMLGMFVPLDKLNADSLIRRQSPKEIKNRLTSHGVNEIVLWLKSKTKWREMDGEVLRHLNSKYINFLNCTVELPSLIIHDHNPSFCCTNVIHAEYTNNFTDYKNSIFFKMLTDFFDDDQGKINLLQEIFAVTIAGIPLKHFFYIYGVPDSGKSKIADILRYITGSEYTSAISLKRFDTQFGLGGLYRKRLNIVGESNEVTSSGVEVIKRLTGGDYCLGEKKYEHAFEFFPQATLVFMSNHKLKVIDGQADQAFLNRMIVLEFAKSIPIEKQDVKLSQKLKSPEEISAILAWTFEGVQRLYKNNFEITRVVNSEDYVIQGAFERNKNENEKEVLSLNFKNYLNESFFVEPKNKDVYASVPALFKGFKEYMGTNEDFDYKEAKWLHDTLQDEFNLQKKRVKPMGQKKQVYAYYGLVAKTEDEKDV